MRKLSKIIILLCILITGIALFFRCNTDNDTTSESTSNPEDVVIIEAKVEDIVFRDNGTWIYVEYKGESCVMHCLDTEFKNKNDVPIEPRDIKAGQNIKAYVSEIVTYDPTTFECYTVWTQGE